MKRLLKMLLLVLSLGVASTALSPMHIGSAAPVTQVAGPTLTVNAAVPTRPISPYIYGMNWVDTALMNELDLPVNRWGGNAVSRYNYQNDVSNHGSDWYFENVKESSATNMPNDSAANRFIEANNSAGTDTVLTVPMTGYVSNSNSGTTGCGFRISLYGAQQGNDWQWRPDCGNGVWTNGSHVTGNNPADTSIAITQTFVAGWVNFLEARYGAANTTNGVRFYALDNEPDLWFETHRDAHPTGASYDELYTRGAAYAAAIKAADPTAQVLGPVSWGWWGYFYSALDVQTGGPEWWNTRPDRMAHGDTPFLEWYLTQMQAYQTNNGVRILDYLDIHYYPQNGVALTTAGDATRQANRLASTKSLWHPTYNDGTWIGEPAYLIPRMRDLIDDNYPGTKLAITEYNWGGLEHINGALAQADILGIFGREGVDLATIWGPPGPTQPGAYAFRMYLNYDGAGSNFGDTSLQASSTNQDQLSIYASRDGSSGPMKLMIINKTASNLNSTVNISGFSPASTANVYRYSSANLNAIVTSTQAVGPTGFTATFPANSITLVVIPSSTNLFADVPTAGKEWMQPYIEQFYSLGITSGCATSPLRYCPEDPVNRGAMAVFLLRAMNYPDLPHTPANTTPNPFADVPTVGKEWMEPWIEEFYSLGVTGGCNVNPLRYCPESSVTRAAMAVFILRAIEGPSYVPTPDSSHFTDVPVAGKEWMEPWVDELYERGITGGCGTSPMRFCPEDPVTRGAMAVFILRAFEDLPQP